MNDYSDQMSIVPEAKGPSVDARPVWVPVIGTLSAVLGGLRLYECLLNFAALAVLCHRFEELGRAMVSSSIVTMIADTALAGMLLLAGIALLRRNRLAVLHLGYAALGIIWFAYMFWRWLSGTIWPINLPYGFTLLHLLPRVAYPAFALYWFCQARVRAQVWSWGRSPSAPPGET